MQKLIILISNNLYLELIISFRLMWFISVVFKILMPKTAFTWIRSFLLKFHYFNISTFNSMQPIWTIFIIVLTVESLLFVFINTKNRLFIYINFFVLLFFLFISILAYVMEIPGSCGCFGALIVWQNDLYKILFNLILTGGAFYLVYNHKK